MSVSGEKRRGHLGDVHGLDTRETSILRVCLRVQSTLDKGEGPKTSFFKFSFMKKYLSNSTFSTKCTIVI